MAIEERERRAVGGCCKMVGSRAGVERWMHYKVWRDGMVRTDGLNGLDGQAGGVICSLALYQG